MTTNTDGAMPELPDNDIDGEEIGKIIADCTVTFEGGFSHLDNDMFASVIRSAMEDYARAAIEQAAGAVPEGCRIVPMEPSKAMLDRAVAFALNVSLGGSYGWTDYMRDLYARMLSAVPSKAGSSVHLGGGECGRVQRVELSGDELALFQRTLDGFADCGETETDYETLVNWARRGLLECTNFRPTAAAHRMLATSTSTEQKGGAA